MKKLSLNLECGDYAKTLAVVDVDNDQEVVTP
jgi:hypothetical protein